MFRSPLDSLTMYGELVPIGGGDSIPLLKTVLTVGRRESADIVLRFPNVSGQHCELSLLDGVWVVKDLRSSNGTKVNGTRVTEQKLQPGDKLSIAKHEFEISYTPAHTSNVPAPQPKSVAENIFNRSLLETAGLEANRIPDPRPSSGKPRRHSI
jgi:pSer/pThr/pTyr-binding forkhead associated (FHA) protein